MALGRSRIGPKSNKKPLSPVSHDTHLGSVRDIERAISQKLFELQSWDFYTILHSIASFNTGMCQL